MRPSAVLINLTPEKQDHKRLFGLDLMRVAAVLLVVAGHLLEHAKVAPWIFNFKRVGIFGVEIFFVLSGFLIGGILITEVKAQRFVRLTDLFSFWFRRWMRTLPLYYLFLILYSRYEWTGPTQINDHPEYLVFMQNLAWRIPNFYIISWSLAVEEFFYLTFPLLLWILLKLLKPTRAFVVSITGFMLVPLVIRWITTPYPDWDGFDFSLRMMTIKHLDAPMYGVAAVFVKEFLPSWWTLLRRWTLAFTVLFVAACLHIYLFDNRDLWIAPQNWPLQVLYFPLLATLTALLLPYFSEPRSPGRTVRTIVTYISTVSYSIYLVHPLVITGVRNVLDQEPGRLEAMDRSFLLTTLLYSMLILVASSITYYGWEKPFLWLRDSLRVRKHEKSL